MENQNVDKDQPCPEDSSQLSRNRSFKTKQLVRSQALRESHSPPRTVSPTAITFTEPIRNAQNLVQNPQKLVQNPQNLVQKPQNLVQTTQNSLQTAQNSVQIQLAHDDVVRTTSDLSSQNSKCLSDSQNKHSDSVSQYGYPEDGVKHNVEIQITSNTWESEPEHEESRQCISRSGSDLLSNHPRVTCVCGGCDHCPHCRGRRRKLTQTTKQDSGIHCSEDCPDWSDTEQPDEQNHYCRCTERKEKSKNTTFYRSDSDERSELNEIELVAFIKCTLNKNIKDRIALLKIEKELHALVNDKGRCVVRFPMMTSYGRMLVHRVATLYQLAHHIDPNNKLCVLVSKDGTSGGRIPCTSFKQWCTINFPQSPTHTAQDAQAKSILKRSSHSLDETCRRAGDAGFRSKSLEQREMEYERVRRRIFAQEQQKDESQWPWLPGPLKLLTPDNGKNKLMKVQSLECDPGRNERTLRSERGVVSKSHSVSGDEPRTARLLSRQGDLAASNWRLSPSSSGYKTLSLRSTDSITPSPTDEVSPEPGWEGVVWCVTDLSSVPPGALLIHPKSGRALTNPDGSVYHYDPNNPPEIYDNNAPIYNAEDSNEKRRGRLEKQNSFIDNECESQTTEECRNKNCYCNCRGGNDETKPNLTLLKTPTSPRKTQYEQPTNHSTPNVSTNQQVAYEMSANQSAPTLTNQSESYEMQQYGEEPCPPQPHAYIQQDTINLTKTTPPIQMQDNHTRPVQMSEPMYQQVQQGYNYTQQCKMDPQMSNTMYQCMVPQQEENKHHTQEPSFRIDASYPYCMEQWPTACTHPHSYTVPYVESAPLVQPVQNMLLQSHHYQIPPYQPVQWQPGIQQIQPILAPSIQSNCATPIQKPNTPPNMYLQPELPVYPLYKPELYPNQQIYPITLPYQNYPYPYIPQILPNSYPFCQQVYNYEKERKNPIVKYQRPNQNDEKNDDIKRFEKKFAKPQRNEGDISSKIQLIKDQIAALSTNSVDKEDKVEIVEKREEFRRRNNGNGILGNHPNNASHGFNRNFNRPPNDETQLTSAARAIVNSIRNMQTKNYYPRTSRPQSATSDSHEYVARPRESTETAESRNVTEESKGHHHRSDRGQYRGDFPRRTQNFNSAYRPPYIYRQMAPNMWCRKSPGPFPQSFNSNPRRSPPDYRLNKRQ